MGTTAKIWSGAAAAVALIVMLVLLSLGLGWFGAGAHVVSAENVQKQYGTVIGEYNDMVVAAQNACTVQKSVGKASTDKEPTLVESPTLAYEATFRNLVSKYSATVDNPFEGKVVVPPGYPTSHQLAGLDTTDWCTVSSQLQSLKG